jgi:predicted DsbA family dithiol-disulfide isomerase
MKVDIWLDIRCPNCFIGKRRFEAALAQFENKDEIRLIWHSFELSVNITCMPGKSVYEYLAELKGKSIEWSHQIYKSVAASAAELGLEYNFDKTIIANSFDAHRIFQHARTRNLASEALERLYYAYFTEGLDISDHATLTRLGAEMGFPEEEISEILTSGRYSAEVRSDEARAESVVITGVPFFLMNNLQGMSGSQSTEIYLQTLREAWQHFEKQRQGLLPDSEDDDACTIYGFC